jgi:hypothetical protein
MSFVARTLLSQSGGKLTREPRMEELLARIIVEAVMILAGMAIAGLVRWLRQPPAATN